MCVLNIMTINSHVNHVNHSNYSMTEWVKSNTTLSDSPNYGFIVGYYNNNITLLGGGDFGDNHVLEYNINTSSITSNYNTLSISTCMTYSAGFISLNTNIYFTNAAYDESLEKNFFVYNMETKTISNLGATNPKPFDTTDECYTTENIQYIYIISGIQPGNTYSNPAMKFYIFNINNLTWTVGPDLHYPHTHGACVYINHSDMLYIFGGTDIFQAFGYIETLNNVSYATSDGYNEQWISLGRFTEGISFVNAFHPSYSNSIFIYGNGWANDIICYVWYIKEQTTDKCEHSPVDSRSGLIYIDHSHTYFSFGGWDNVVPHEARNYIESVLITPDNDTNHYFLNI